MENKEENINKENIKVESAKNKKEENKNDLDLDIDKQLGIMNNKETNIKNPEKVNNNQNIIKKIENNETNQPILVNTNKDLNKEISQPNNINKNNLPLNSNVKNQNKEVSYTPNTNKGVEKNKIQKKTLRNKNNSDMDLNNSIKSNIKPKKTQTMIIKNENDIKTKFEVNDYNFFSTYDNDFIKNILNEKNNFRFKSKLKDYKSKITDTIKNKILLEHNSLKQCFNHYKDIKCKIIEINNILNNLLSENFDYLKIFLIDIQKMFNNFNKNIYKTNQLNKNQYKLNQSHDSFNVNINIIMDDIMKMFDNKNVDDLNTRKKSYVSNKSIINNVENKIIEILNSKIFLNFKSNVTVDDNIFKNIYEYMELRDQIIEDIKLYCQLIYGFYEKSRELYSKNLKFKKINLKNIIKELNKIFNKDLVNLFNPFVEEINKFNDEYSISSYFNLANIINSIIKNSKKYEQIEKINCLNDFNFIYDKTIINIPKFEEYVLLCKWDISMSKGIFSSKKLIYVFYVDIFNNIFIYSKTEKKILTSCSLEFVNIIKSNQNSMKFKLKSGLFSKFKGTIFFIDNFHKDGFEKFINFIRTTFN